MCGTESNSTEAKFCTNCGAEHANSLANAKTSRSIDEINKIAHQAVLGEPSESETAIESIIGSADVLAMQRCIELAEANDQNENIEFWYGELITADEISNAERGEYLLKFVRSYLVNRNRFAEAEFLVVGLMSWDQQFQNQVPEILIELLSGLEKHGSRFVPSDTWDKEEYRGPLSDAFAGQTLFEFFLFQLVHSQSDTNNFFRSIMLPEPSTIYPDFFGYYHGLKLNKLIDNETFWQAATTHIRLLRKEIPIPTKGFEYLASRVLARMLPAEFSKDGFMNFNNGSNLTERVYSILSISEKVGDTTDINQGFLILTSDRIYLYKTSGMFSDGYSKSYWKSDLQSVEIGDSGHQQLSGFTSRNTSWVTISIVKKDGSSSRKHFYLGGNSREIAPNEKLIKKTILDAIDLGYPISDGDGVYSQAGYRMSMGFGVITPLD